MAYRIYLYPDQRQENILSALLKARDTLGTLVGFPTYAHRTLAGTMVSSPGMEFLKKIMNFELLSENVILYI